MVVEGSFQHFYRYVEANVGKDNSEISDGVW